VPAGAELEAMREALGDDEEVPLPVLDGPERRLERAAALVDEIDHRGRVVLEEVVHRRRRRRDVHRRRRVGDEARHAAVEIARRRRGRDGQQQMRAADGRERRLPGGREGVEDARLAGQPVGRRIEVVGVGDLAGESAAPVLLLVEVAQQWSGVRRAGDDTDLGKASEVFVLVHAPPPA
jgi:hypothetical protein